ncbi:MAG: aminotransferase class III-fold pyridoxal phosphate-dependent enzyme [Saprospiraceae bacterium]|nr:aminotransferase class III-fold pyridoxal phosphate-dependent enzyme [Saprospiraceae bacterium]
MKTPWSEEALQEVLKNDYNLQGKLTRLGGDVDYNYRIDDQTGNTYILKVSADKKSNDYIKFQHSLLNHLALYEDIRSPEIKLTTSGSDYITKSLGGKPRIIRVLSWMYGNYWAQISIKKKSHFHSLGEYMASITDALQSFDHPLAHRSFEWDLNQASWLGDAINIHKEDNHITVSYFLDKYNESITSLLACRKGIVHNDGNENNVLVQGERVSSVIDYGDAIYTSIVNDVAIAIAYGVMEVEDPLSAASWILHGYHNIFPLLMEEIDLIYRLVGIRLAISVTKSSQASITNPDSEYHQITARSAWGLIHKWRNIPESFANAKLRKACGYNSLDHYQEVTEYIKENRVSINNFLVYKEDFIPAHINLSIGSDLLHLPDEYNDPDSMQAMLYRYMNTTKVNMVYGGYLESRPFYITEAYKVEGPTGPEYRSIHLGEDYWVPADTEVRSPLDGKVFLVQDNQYYKDYGPTIILIHKTNSGIPFYTLYGHLTRDSLDSLKPGDKITKDSIVGRVGHKHENGSWAPHLHFQIITDLLDNKSNFHGVARPSEMKLWEELCPCPGFLIDVEPYPVFNENEITDLSKRRQKVLGPSLSVSYVDPLYIVRGYKQYLYDYKGQKFLDMVNNVPHVGHQHPRIVESLRSQASILNTNSRYLHPLILEYADALLKEFPDPLEVVYLVNSGSEANELALRMCRTITGQQHVIAIEGGYHGNTQACIDVSSYKFDGKGGKGKPSTTSLLPLPDSFRGKHRGSLDETGSAYAKYINGILNDLSLKGNAPAAFIHESILSCGGQLVLPTGYLSYLYDKTRQAGGFCIADEVQTGFGRVGTQFWAFQLQGVLPDIVTLGKPMGNGHPLGAVVCTREVAEQFNNGMEFFSTYGGNPVSCAIGLEVLSIVKDEGLQEHARNLGHYTKASLGDILNKVNVDIRGEGLFLGVEFLKEDRPDDQLAERLVQEMRHQNILLSTDGPDHNVIKMKPPMCINKKDINEFLERFQRLYKAFDIA